MRILPYLTVLALCCGTAPAFACSLVVNGSGNGGDVADADLSLFEAQGIASGDFGALSCLTQNELDQISGETSVPAIGICGTVDPRFNIVGGCGVNDADQIGFNNSVNTINSVGHGLTLISGDSVDGLKPNGGRVTLLGDGGGPGPIGVRILRDGFSTQPDTVSVRNLIIRDYGSDGVYAPDMRGTVTLTGLDIFNNGGDGIQLGTTPGDPFPDCAGIVSIGGALPGEENFIFSNGGYGIRINEACNSFDSVGVTLHNNHIGFDSTAGTLDAGNSLGGISVFFARNVLIGGPGSNQRNYIGWNDGPGIDVVDPLFIGNQTRVQGNWIGLAKDFPPTPRPNAEGIAVVRSVNVLIGGSSAAEGNVISGNTGHGVIATPSVSSTVVGLQIENNIVGLNPERLASVANTVSGVALTNVGSATLRSNILSGNTQQGVYIGGASNAIVFENNVIGLRGPSNNSNDNTAAGNGAAGIWIDGCSACVVGPGNKIAGNAVFGLWIRGDNSDNVSVRGNVIGLSSGNDPRPNGVGVFVEGGADGIRIGGSAAADRNTISANTFEGIRVSGSGSDGAVIQNNRIGTDASGTTDLGNGSRGVRIDGGAGSAEITNNLISGNGSDGISMEAATGNSKIQGNTLGLNITGTVLANAQSGVALAGGTQNVLVGGGPQPNVIAGNGNYGIYVADSGTSNNTVQGNRIGTELAGQGNGLSGIILRAGASNNLIDDNTILHHAGAPGVDIEGVGTRLNTLIRNRIGLTASNAIAANAGGIRVRNLASDNQIGTNSAIDRNVISGNLQYGVAFNAAGTFNTLQSNLIGLADSGTIDRGNSGPGVLIENGTTNTSIINNTVSGNSEGVRIQGSTTGSNSLQRNRIGTTSDGTGSVPNDAAGIHITGDAQRNSIGAADSNFNANIVRFNGGPGVWVESGQDNRIRTNSIGNNAGLGIDLGSVGVAANDGAGDPDTGANGLQNFPVLSNITRGGGMLSFDVSLASRTGTEFAIDVYGNLACDGSMHGEGETFIGSFSLNTDSSGSATGSVMMPFPDTTPATTYTATAMSRIDSIDRGSSEFAACVADVPLQDPIFGSGFEDEVQLPAAAGIVQVKMQDDAQGMWAENVGDGRVVWHIERNNAGIRPMPARVLTLSADQALLIHSTNAWLGHCEQLGAIICAFPELSSGARSAIRVELTPSALPAVLTVVEQTRAAAARIAQMEIDMQAGEALPAVETAPRRASADVD